MRADYSDVSLVENPGEPADVWRNFTSAYLVGMAPIFNILGNQLRLITVASWRARRIYVKALLTHKQNDKKEWMKWARRLSVRENTAAYSRRRCRKRSRTIRELERFSEMLESLDPLGRELTPEERALDVLLARLIADYDEKIDLPALPAHETIVL